MIVGQLAEFRHWNGTGAKRLDCVRFSAAFTLSTHPNRRTQSAGKPDALQTLRDFDTAGNQMTLKRLDISGC